MELIFPFFLSPLPPSLPHSVYLDPVVCFGGLDVDVSVAHSFPPPTTSTTPTTSTLSLARPAARQRAARLLATSPS